MNKGQLVEAVAGKLGSRSAAEDAVDAVLDAMVRAVVAGDKVQVTGFGTLESVQRSARTARNPQTGEAVRVKKSTVPRFRPGQGFKDLVSGAKKMPKQGPSIMKAPKGSLTAGTTGTTAKKAAPAAKRTAAKRAGVATATTVAKKAAAKKTTAKKTTTRKTTAAAAKTTAPARKTATTKKTTARKTTAAAAKTTASARKTATAKKAAPAKRTSTRRTTK